MRALVILLFIYSNTFGQNQKIIDYNEYFKELYEHIQLEPFQESDSEYHLRLIIRNSMILDVWKEGNDVKGFAYNYVYQEEKQIMLNDFRKVNTYLFKKESIDKDMIELIINKSDSILKLDSIEVRSYWRYSCIFTPPLFSLEYKDKNELLLFERIKIESLGYLVDHYLFKYEDFISNLPPGRYDGFSKIDYDPATFSGVSSEYSSRKEQNIDLLSNYNSSFGIRNNTDFTEQWINGGRSYSVLKLTDL